ncbi:MAG: CzcABC family efflux RND transporter, transmembrane protein [Cytophagales bacterium]|jgi:cobalt-zinc-cadmium resistance protein CzcA|nr:efflux RND transporter permease subunit [Bacteroidota bacterium]MBS1982466.1 efflux RND transporter permease subunit [Bacteroidota bacterium]WHZ06267.1 MAG: CzcABC family efflux RND transporter, transmembrane protein [Cytophagales bacterium]
MLRLLKGIITFSLANRAYVLFFAAALIISGYISYRNTPIVAFPDLTNTRITIITQWPGRSAQEIERFITIPIEIEMNTVPKRTQVRSISLFGLSVVYIIFDDNVQDFEGRQYVINRLANVDFPDGISPSLTPPQGPTDEIFRFTLESKQFNARDMKTIMDWVIDRGIKSVPGVADLVSFGGQVKTYEISIDPALLGRYDITISDVFNAISKSNINVGGDVITHSQQAYVVRGIGLLTDIKSIRNVIIDTYGGSPVFLKDVGKVQESNLPPLGYVGRDTTKNTVEGIVILRKGENPSPVIDALKEKIKDLNENVLPGDMKIIPFYDRSNLINYTIETVTHNLLEGMFLVCLVVMLFLGDWRATLVASFTIPFALLFAFFCLRMMGMSANLLSLGAIDFGIIVDGTVVMTEGLFIVLDKKAHHLGMERFNKTIKLGDIRKAGQNLSRSVFFAALIILTALLPIFAFQRVEGKMFSPLAFTLGFALIGALISALTIVPVLVSYLLSKNVVEKHTFMTRGLSWIFERSLTWVDKNRKISYGIAAASWLIAIFSAFSLGTEFLPHLNEGAIYIRAQMPYSTSLQQSIDISEKLRTIMASYPEVKRVLSQTGRPNDGTDATGFFNIELHAELLPKKEWKRHITKDELISEMRTNLEEYPGIVFNFSQPIMDNVEEAVSGVKGSLAVKIFGYEPEQLESYAAIVNNELHKVPGVADLGIIHLKGQPEIQILLDQDKMAAYGVTTVDASAVIEMAVGGKTVTEKFEGERKFDIRVRYLPEYRNSPTALGNLLVPTVNKNQVKLSSIADIKAVSGNAFLYRENNRRFIAVKFSVSGRDLGSTIAEAQKRISKVLPSLPKGMSIEWKGEFENQVRATARLKQVIPISLGIIFILLFTAFGNVRDAALIFLNVPFSLMGGILALHITGTNFSIAAGIGFICLFGIAVQAGVILISFFKLNLQEGMPLRQAVFYGTLRRVRPVFMTALMSICGLSPAALSTGIGSETQKPLAIVVIGGLFTDMILALHVFPLIVEWVYSRSKNIAK